jgi:hypothetical protein
VRLMRYEVEHGPAIARHNDCLAIFYVTGKLGKPILGIADRDDFHTLIVATSGYRVKLTDPRPAFTGLSFRRARGRPDRI